ncbi:MAG TPA: hypothetical protein VK709_09735 [Candidatus Saccharimonadales bacterium]|jgi:hypothetical protein|nr:hypothetical protein [Candidatus Saccharimonadales bacterium]
MFFTKAKSALDDEDSGTQENSTRADPLAGFTRSDEEFEEGKTGRSIGGHSLFQELFFFCNVKNVGDVRGTGCIYVETVVDRDTGCAFAKVYPARNAMNSVDTLSTRVLPYFKKMGIAVKEIHTRKTPEYCGLVPIHPFETFLSSYHIQHLSTNQPGKPYSYLCVQFYRYLQYEFFQPALRMKFMLTLDELQTDLDAFMEAFNAMRWKRVS